MVAVSEATIHSEEAGPMAQPMSVLGIDLAKLVFHIVGMADTGAVVLRKRLGLGGHQRGSRHCYPVAWVAYPT
jgi:hypothetical protein